MNNLSYIDIFAGCGGLSLGLFKAGWKGLFAVEKSRDAFSTLKHNLIDKNNHFEWTDWLPQTEHDINELLKVYSDNLNELHGKVPLIVGGPPCQGFSMAGKRDENDVRNALSHSYLEFVKILHPGIVFFENVHGFTCVFQKAGTQKIPHSKFVKNELEKLGYTVRHEVVDMSLFGIPQKRKRFILVGCLDKDPNIFLRSFTNIVKAFLRIKDYLNVLQQKMLLGICFVHMEKLIHWTQYIIKQEFTEE